MDVTPDTTAVRGFWDSAFKRSPKAARFLFVGFLVLAVAAIVMAWRVSIGSLVVKALLVLVAAVVVTLVLKEISRSKPSVIAAFCCGAL